MADGVRPDLYRGARIEAGYVGYYATFPGFECEVDDEGCTVGNGLQVHAMTLDGVRAEVDAWYEERDDLR